MRKATILSPPKWAVGTGFRTRLAPQGLFRGVGTGQIGKGEAGRTAGRSAPPGKRGKKRRPAAIGPVRKARHAPGPGERGRTTRRPTSRNLAASRHRVPEPSRPRAAPGALPRCPLTRAGRGVRLLTVLRGAVAEGEPEVTAVDVLDGNGHLSGRKSDGYAPVPTPPRSGRSVPPRGPAPPRGVRRCGGLSGHPGPCAVAPEAKTPRDRGRCWEEAEPTPRRPDY